MFDGYFNVLCTLPAISLRHLEVWGGLCEAEG